MTTAHLTIQAAETRSSVPIVRLRGATLRHRGVTLRLHAVSLRHHKATLRHRGVIQHHRVVPPLRAHIRRPAVLPHQATLPAAALMAEETAAIRTVRRTADLNNRHRFQVKFVQKPACSQQAFYLHPRVYLAALHNSVRAAGLYPVGHRDLIR